MRKRQLFFLDLFVKHMHLLKYSQFYWDSFYFFFFLLFIAIERNVLNFNA